MTTADRQILSGIAWVTLFALVGRCAGAAKEMAIAWRFGVNPEVDGYLFVLTLVTLPSALWFSVLTAVLVPMVSSWPNRWSAALQRFARELLLFTMALGVLLAAYAGYTRVFALVAAGLRTNKDAGAYTHVPLPSQTQRMAHDLANQGFGRGHWATDEKLPIRIYQSDKGLYIYARDYERKNDGKTIVLTPFALVWRSRDGRGLKTLTSDSATIDLEQPFSLITKPGSSGGGMKVIRARVEGEVRLHDDKSTIDTADDMKISGPTRLAYDENTLEIVSEDNDVVVIEDSVYRAIGKGLLIKLRPRENDGTGQTSGFNGAQTAVFKKDVFITLFDVGPGGMLPGNAGVKRAKSGAPTPLT